MMKINKACLVSALTSVFAVCFFASPVEAEAQSNRIKTLGGINYTARTSWNPKFQILPSSLRDDKYKEFGSNYFLEYDFAADSFATYEGALTDQKLGLNIGLTAEMDDNIVGKVNKYSGYLGIKSLMLRLQSGRMRGTASWIGDDVPGMDKKIEFDSKYSDVSLVYWIGKLPFDYVGLSYVTFGLPLQIETMTTETDKTKQIYGKPVYDKDFKANIYAVGFGIDTFVTPFLFPDIAERDAFYKAMAQMEEDAGWNLYITMQMMLGYGRGRVSDEALLFAEAANPGRKAVSLGGVMYHTGDIGFGLQYNINRKFTFGLGYNWAVTGLNSSRAAKNNTELGYRYDFNLMRHGPVLRAYFAF